MTQQTFDVPDISCGHCKTAIENELSGVAGVDSVVVDIDAKTVAVTGDATTETVVAAISEAGYEVQRAQ